MISSGDTAASGEGGRTAMRLTGEREREVGERGSEKEREQGNNE